MNAIILPAGAADASQTVRFPFNVELSYPENQIEPDAGYFYVDAEDGRSYAFAVRITNTGMKHSKSMLKRLIAIPPPAETWHISAIIRALGGNSRHPVPAGDNIILPKTSSPSRVVNQQTTALQSGHLSWDRGRFWALYASLLSRKASGHKQKGTQINLDIKRAVTIVIRLRLDQAETLEGPSITVGEAGFLEEMGMLYLTLENNLPFINRKARGHLVLADSTGETLFNGAFDLIRMAPRSWLKWPIPLDAGIIEAGTLYAVVSFDDTGAESQTREIQLEQDVEIIDEPVPPAAAPSEAESPKTHWSAYVGWLLFALTAALLLLLLMRKRKKES
jgi:hypothetical protein